ncbi:MAG: DUF2088 domain-containing protein [Spirochaetaceae bacterium]|nr:MAG: DUF2088 domain-containing protein [Spirochaetaceae bacterium]
MLDGITIPRMVRVRQNLDATRIESIPATVRAELSRPEIAATVRSGMSIAITCGSRGVANIAEITREIASALKAAGAHPFVFPAMGSHGGGNAEGQLKVLANLGVTEASVGVPIRSSMDVVQIGTLEDGRPVMIDRLASEADGIVVVGRVKPHTAFRGPYESGLFKMLAIGLGKHRGAEMCHDQGFARMAENVPAFARAILRSAKILFGVAIIENAHDETCRIVALEKGRIEADEPALLEEARSRMARIGVSNIDVMIVDEIGKNHSGDGMDPNITGSYSTEYASGDPAVKQYVVLDVDPASYGNIVGVGRADFTTKRVYDQADFDATYPNALTAKVPLVAKMPMVLATDKLAIQAAIKMCSELGGDGVRVVRIRNSSHVDEIFVSESLVAEIESSAGMKVLEAPAEMRFDETGALIRT